MSHSASLLHGANYNKTRTSIQEGMQDMERLQMTNLELSSNPISQDEIQRQLRESNKKYEDLINKFDTIKDQLGVGIKNYIDNDLKTNRTVTASGNKLDHALINVLVTEPSGVSISDAKYEGCFTDNSNQRAIQNQQSDGYVFSVDACAQRAIDQGKTVFGLQNVNDNGLAQCYIGDDIEAAKQYNQAYGTKHYWYAKGKGGIVKESQLLKLFSNGVMMLFSTSDATENESDVMYSTYRDGDGKMADGCNKETGGTIQNVIASYGVNCLSSERDYKPAGDGEPPFVGNYTPYLANLMGLDKGLYNVSFEKGDPAKYCQKDFDVTYSCGDGPTKTIKIPGSSDGKPVVLDCSPEANRCKEIRMVMQNDGNLVIIDGDKNILWESGTASTSNVGDVAVDDWIKRSLNGRDFLRAGETMKRGDIIASSSGKNMVVLDNGGYLILICSSGSKCKVVNNKTYGTSGNNAVYSLAKSVVQNLGEMAYIDGAGQKYAYPTFSSSVDVNHNKFITIGSYTSYDSDITSFSTSDVTQCEEAASKNPDCGGFVFNKTQQRCFLKGKQMWPRAQRVYDTDCIMKIKAPKIDVDNSCSTDFNAVNTSLFELYPTSNQAMAPDTKCGLSRYVNENKPPYDEENTELMNELTSIMGQIQTLAQQRDANLNTMPTLRNKISQRYDEYQKLKKDYEHYHDRQYDPTISKYREDSEMNRNMFGADSTIFALLGVGGLLLAMRLMK